MVLKSLQLLVTLLFVAAISLNGFAGSAPAQTTIPLTSIRPWVPFQNEALAARSFWWTFFGPVPRTLRAVRLAMGASKAVPSAAGAIGLALVERLKISGDQLEISYRSYVNGPLEQSQTKPVLILPDVLEHFAIDHSAHELLSENPRSQRSEADLQEKIVNEAIEWLFKYKPKIVVYQGGDAPYAAGGPQLMAFSSLVAGNRIAQMHELLEARFRAYALPRDKKVYMQRLLRTLSPAGRTDYQTHYRRRFKTIGRLTAAQRLDIQFHYAVRAFTRERFAAEDRIFTDLLKHQGESAAGINIEFLLSEGKIRVAGQSIDSPQQLAQWEASHSTLVLQKLEQMAAFLLNDLTAAHTDFLSVWGPLLFHRSWRAPMNAFPPFSPLLAFHLLWDPQSHRESIASFQGYDAAFIRESPAYEILTALGIATKNVQNDETWYQLVTRSTDSSYASIEDLLRKLGNAPDKTQIQKTKDLLAGPSGIVEPPLPQVGDSVMDYLWNLCEYAAQNMSALTVDLFQEEALVVPMTPNAKTFDRIVIHFWDGRSISLKHHEQDGWYLTWAKASSWPTSALAPRVALKWALRRVYPDDQITNSISVWGNTEALTPSAALGFVIVQAIAITAARAGADAAGWLRPLRSVGLVFMWGEIAAAVLVSGATLTGWFEPRTATIIGRWMVDYALWHLPFIAWTRGLQSQTMIARAKALVFPMAVFTGYAASLRGIVAISPWLIIGIFATAFLQYRFDAAAMPRTMRRHPTSGAA